MRHTSSFLTNPANIKARLTLLPLNPFFADSVRQIREKLGLPPEGIRWPRKALEWALEHQNDEAILAGLRGILGDYGLPETLDLELLQYLVDNNPAHFVRLGPGTGHLRAVHQELGNDTAELRVVFSITGDTKEEVMAAVEQGYDRILRRHKAPRARRMPHLEEDFALWRQRYEQGKTGAQIAAELRARGEKITPQAVNKRIRQINALIRPLSTQPASKPHASSP